MAYWGKKANFFESATGEKYYKGSNPLFQWKDIKYDREFIKTNIGFDKIIDYIQDLTNIHSIYNNFKLIPSSKPETTHYIVPSEINCLDLPNFINEFYQIQLLFMNYDSNDENQTKKLLDFIDKNPVLGLRELEICTLIRPRLIQNYVTLYTRLPARNRLLARQQMNFIQPFLMLLNKYDPKFFFDTHAKSSNTESIYFLITNLLLTSGSIAVNFFNDVASLENAIIDNPDFFISYITDNELKKQAKKLIALFALYGAVNCFKLFLLNGVSIKGIDLHAIAGGNQEIIRLFAQNESKFVKGTDIALIFRQDELYNWLFENYPPESQFRDPCLLITETMSISAMYALSQTNNRNNFIDIISSAYLDESIEICRYFSKFTLFNCMLFYLISDEEILQNFLDNANSNVLLQLINFGISNNSEWYLKFIFEHGNISEVSFSEDIKKSLEQQFPSAYEIMTNISNREQKPEKLYRMYMNGHPISNENAMSLIQYCIEINDITHAQQIFSAKFSAFSIEQAAQISKKCPAVTQDLDRIFNFEGIQNDIILLIIRYSSGKQSEKIGKEIMKEPQEFFDLLNPFDYLNLCDFPVFCFDFITNILIKKGFVTSEQIAEIDFSKQNTFTKPNYTAFGYGWIRSNSMTAVSYHPAHQIQLLKKCIIKSDIFQAYLQSHRDELTHYLFSSSVLVPLFMNQKVSQEVFDICVRAYLYTLSDVYLSIINENRNFVDVQKLSKSPFNFDLLQQLHFTREEFEYMEKIRIFIPRLIVNPRNAVYLKSNQCLFAFKPAEIVAALDYIEITDEIIQFLNSKAPEKYRLTPTSFKNDKILHEINNDHFLAYLEFSGGDYRPIIMDEFFRRNFSDDKIALYIVRCSQSHLDEIIKYVDKMDIDIRFLLSIKCGKLFVMKNDTIPISAIYLIKKHISTEQFNDVFQFILDNFRDNKATLTHALYFPLPLDWLKKFIENGAYINVIIDHESPRERYCIQHAIYDFIEVGGDIGYRQGTLFQSEETFRYYKREELYKAKLFNKQYEIRFHPPLEYKNDVSEDNWRIDLILAFATGIHLEYRSPSKHAPNFIDKLMNCKLMSVSLFYLCLFSSRYDELFTPFGIEFVGLHERDIPEIVEYIDKNYNTFTDAFNNVYCVLNSIDSIVQHEDNCELLYLATRIGNIQIIKSLLEKGGNIEEVEGYYFLNSPSLEAIAKHRPDILKLFIDHGLNVDKIYSSDDLTLINACIWYNSVECFNLVFERCSLEHYVSSSPMTIAIQQYAKGNKYFAMKLYNKIDKVLERIESPLFVQFEHALQNGTEFIFTPENDISSFPIDGSKIPRSEYSSMREIPDSFTSDHVVQFNLRLNISYRKHTPYTIRYGKQYKFNFIKGPRGELDSDFDSD